MTNQINKATITQQDASLDVSQQTKDSVSQTMTDSNTAPCETPSTRTSSLTKELAVFNRERIRCLHGDQLIQALRKHTQTAAEAFSAARQHAVILVDFYEQMEAEFKQQHVAGEKRDGKPTLSKAFDDAGWPYHSARKWYYRHRPSLEKHLCLGIGDEPEKIPALPAGCAIRNIADDKEYLIEEPVDRGFPSADLSFKNGDGEIVKLKATRLYNDDGVPLFEKVPSPVKKIEVGDLVILTDMYGGGAEYKYDGGKEFSRTATPTIAEQKRMADDKKTRKKNPPDLATQPPPIPSTEQAVVKKPSTKTKKTVAPKTLVAAHSGSETGEFAVFEDTDAKKTVASACSGI